jgi:hypothetical protein
MMVMQRCIATAAGLWRCNNAQGDYRKGRGGGVHARYEFNAFGRGVNERERKDPTRTSAGLMQRITGSFRFVRIEQT